MQYRRLRALWRPQYQPRPVDQAPPPQWEPLREWQWGVAPQPRGGWLQRVAGAAPVARGRPALDLGDSVGVRNRRRSLPDAHWHDVQPEHGDRLHHYRWPPPSLVDRRRGHGAME